MRWLLILANFKHEVVYSFLLFFNYAPLKYLVNMYVSCRYSYYNNIISGLEPSEQMCQGGLILLYSFIPYHCKFNLFK